MMKIHRIMSLVNLVSFMSIFSHVSPMLILQNLLYQMNLQFSGRSTLVVFSTAKSRQMKDSRASPQVEKLFYDLLRAKKRDQESHKTSESESLALKTLHISSHEIIMNILFEKSHGFCLHTRTQKPVIGNTQALHYCESV